ncbi:Asp-tRNA(Asn)/Glu-tRNA(Gln) amidotransferase subunit GatA [Spirochaeta cellobiosiphila]|uniref:Asp-tRNA(Asn)/Glu-tRNA(Gln) amidotransferase subunit GatA n=1 Tax=Spirochaeta cellobiosiphila TaxID=504483 RepID=UPI0004190883|nr:Asp-tRNA(Asn)/Glu-tRNA(Gln) amidotransferase subunit GatA [Spirochaeta cellobiosiphila]
MSQFTKKWVENLSTEVGRKRYRLYVESWEKKIGSFLDFRSENSSHNEGKLKGLPFGVKDNIATRGFKVTCGSKMLENLLSPYTATAVEKLIDAGAYVVGKTNLDEFGMGSSTDNSALQQTNNPWDINRVSGGSSGGSAAAVAAGLVPFALGTDTGGSVRQPASFCGVYGLKPTYGTVSRFGLTAYASSLEVIGVLSKDIDLTEQVYNTIKGEDPKDQTSIKPEVPTKTKGPFTIAVLDNISDLDPLVQKAYDKTIVSLEALGHTVVKVQLPTLEYVVPAYYTIATAEASANLARYTGIRYGLQPLYSENPDDLVQKSRSEGFGDEVKLRILLGTYVLRSGFQDQYYHRAQKIRTAIRNDLDRIFKDVDMLMTPTFPTPAFSRDEKSLTQFQQKVADKFTCTANLAGVPALNVPTIVENNLPVGMQFIAPVFEEPRLFEIARSLKDVFPIQDVPGYSEDWS